LNLSCAERASGRLAPSQPPGGRPADGEADGHQPAGRGGVKGDGKVPGDAEERVRAAHRAIGIRERRSEILPVPERQQERDDGDDSQCQGCDDHPCDRGPGARVVQGDGRPATPPLGHDIIDGVHHVQGVVAVRDRLTYPPAGPVASPGLLS